MGTNLEWLLWTHLTTIKCFPEEYLLYNLQQIVRRSKFNLEAIWREKRPASMSDEMPLRTCSERHFLFAHTKKQWLYRVEMAQRIELSCAA